MRKGVHSVFIVKEKSYLTPHYIRIKFHMSDEQTELFRRVQIGGHNKLFITDDTKRTYTTRHIDFDQKELWVDFIAHGDNGPASHWASRAIPGSLLGIAMKEGGQPLFPEADNYLFAGDHTALPVIGAMLEQLPAGAQAKVILEIAGQADEMTLSSKANLNVRWLHNAQPEDGSRLAEMVRVAELPIGKRFVFVAAEQAIAKNLKRYFKEELSWPREEYSVISYWTRGESEDQSALGRREERMD